MTDSDFIRELLECSVCLEQLDASSKVLPCQHTFCRRCLEGIVETHKELRCPECRIVVGTEICDLPTNILLIRLLDGLKRNPKFVPRHIRQRSHSRPAFRIDRQIFFQSSPHVAPLPAPVSLSRRTASSGRTCTDSRITSAACSQPAVGEVTCPKPMACRVQPQRRSDSHSSTLPPRVVPDHSVHASARTGNHVTGRMAQMPSSSSTRCLHGQDFAAADFEANAFSRSSSHDYLVGMQAMHGHQLPVKLSTASSGRTKSLSRPSSRVSDKHSSLPNHRISVSPNQLESRPTSLALSNKIYIERPKSQTSAPTIIGNPLYGYMGRPDQGPKGEHHIRKSAPLLMSQTCALAQGSRRRVQALYGCVGETFNELSFEPDAIITEGEDGWLIGNYNGRRGLLPQNYVQDLEHRVTD